MITVEKLQKRFGRLTVLDGLDLEIATGQSVVIIGQSGCGKSVLLKHFAALLRPDSGTVTVDGRNIFALSRDDLMSYRRQIGVLFQFGALFDSMTVAENVGFALKESLHLKPAKSRDIVEEKLALVGLPGIGDKMPAEISGGMKKRVALARAIAAEPRILLYDEPTTGLDPITAMVINELIVDVNKKLGVTSIAVTHDMASAYKIADRIVMLHQGNIVFDGSPEDTRTTSDPIVRQFINGLSTGPIAVH
ncbi:MAG: ABC transporter ATP-binding protein [candidate division Zixibacteria bacterium]|nr:ABC transporter ATP-binding protein [candidate division Zixibacteria bacterium]